MVEKRHFRRYQRKSKAKVRYKGNTIRCMLVDYSLSGMGLMVHGRASVPKDEIVDVHVDELSIKSPAVVKWSQEIGQLKRIGLEKRGRFEGRLRDYCLGDILVGLKLTQKTGILDVLFNDIKKSVYVDKGEIIFSASNQPGESLGAFFLRNGVITKDQFIEASKEMKRTGKGFGCVLVNLGYITPHQLFEGVKGQVEDIILSLFELEEGDFVFEEGSIPAEGITRFNLSPGKLIYYGNRRIRDVDRIKRMLPMDATIYFSLNPLKLFQDVQIDEPGRKLLSLIDNKSTIEEVIKRSGLEPSDAIKIIYGFVSMRLLLTAPQRIISVEGIVDMLGDESEDILRREVEEFYDMREKLGYYGILGVKKDATQEEIKKAFYKVAKRFHPDRHFYLEDESIRNKLNAIFSYINEAYAVLSNPEDRAEYDRKVFIRPHAIKPAQSSAVEAYKNAKAYFNSHNYEVAEYYIKQAIYYDGANASYHFLCGLILSRLNRPTEAKEHLQRAVELKPINPDYMAELGWLYLNEGLRLTARTFFDKALKIDPQHKRALTGLNSLSKIG